MKTRCEVTKLNKLFRICKTSKICCGTFKKILKSKKISLEKLRVYFTERYQLKNTLSTENVKSEYGQKEKNLVNKIQTCIF